MSEGPTIGDWTQYEWIPDDASSFPARVRLRNAAWMVYYEPDVTDLKAEVLLLRKENKELRELVRDMRTCIQTADKSDNAWDECDRCSLWNGNNNHRCEFNRRMKELGVEV